MKVDRLLPVPIAAVLLALPAAALAGGKSGGRSGALGSVTSGISSKSSSSRGSSSSGSRGSSSSSRSRDHRSDSSSSSSSSSGYYYGSSYGSSGGCYDCRIRTHRRPRYRLVMPDLDVRLAMAMQSVEDSDGAVLVDARITHKGFGFGLGSNSYYERNRIAGASPETIRMDLWSAYGSARLWGAENTHIDFHGGIAGARSNTFDHLLGGTIGLELQHELSPSLRLEAATRYISLQDDVSAVEYRGGVRAAFIYIGWRSVDFNAGPPLRGPEAGISLLF